MSILLNPYAQRDQWVDALSSRLPDEVIEVWPQVDDPGAIEIVIAWRMPRAVMATFDGLQAILSLGAGGDQWLLDGMPDVPVVRLVDPAMSDEMAAFALHWVIRLQRRFDELAELGADERWTGLPYTRASAFGVGILGYGHIGSRIGRAFVDLGYRVNAWSRSGSGGDDPSVSHYRGLDELEAFLGASDAVVNVLPNTEETTNLLDATRLAAFAEGSILVNIGRGTVLDESALVRALDDGPLRAAVLDVTDPEPPAPGSPLWTHPAVHLTPHVAGSTDVGTAATIIAANVARIRRGETPFPVLDRSRGY